MRVIRVDESYLIIFYSFLIHAIVDGLHYCFGIIVTELIKRRNFSGESIAIVSVLFSTSWNLLTFISSGLHRMYGCRLPVMLGGAILCAGYVAAALTNQDVVSTAVFLGLLLGFGMTLSYTPIYIVANTYYRKWRQMANGIIMSGSAVGLVASAPFSHWLLQQYGIPGTLMILGGCALQVVVLVALIPPLSHETIQNQITEEEAVRNQPEITKEEAVPNQPEITKEEAVPNQPEITKEEAVPNQSYIKQSGKRTQNIRMVFKSIRHKLFHTFIAIDLFKNWRYTFCVLASFFVQSAINYTVYTFLPHLIIQAGHSKKLSWQPITVIAVTNCVAKLTMGISNNTSFVISITFAFSALVLGFCTSILPLVSDFYWLVCVIAGLFGLGKGLYYALRGPVLAETVAEEDIDRAIGTCLSCTGLSPIITYLVLGKLYDITGTYTWTFLLSGSQAILAGMFLLTIACSIFIRQANNMGNILYLITVKS